MSLCWHFVVYSSMLFFSSLFRFPNSFAFIGEITFLPVFSSISFLVFPAIVPPCFAITLFSQNVLGFFSFEISFVVASANMLRTNSKLVMLSLRFSFFRFLNSLYSLTLKPDHAFVISLVNIAYSNPFLYTSQFPFVC